MRMSKLFLPTMREVPAEAEAVSHRLMLRAGLIRKLASGIYSYLPVGYKVFRKIEDIVRQEMEAVGAQEVSMPALLPADIYRQSGRWDIYGPEMFRLKDRSSRDFCLGPTHEEIFAETVKQGTRSYRSFPLYLYQIQTKYRDEVRPRFGVVRSREFVMKDAYSFDRDEQGLELSYKTMYEAYCRIFDRCGLNYTVVEADNGAMGGSGSQEFMVRSEIGEALIASCKACGYAANVERALCVPVIAKDNGDQLESKMVETPGCRTIDELTGFFSCSPEHFAKTLIYKSGDRVIAAMVRGDRELNEIKLRNAADCSQLEMADADTVMKVTGADVGFAGPVGLKAELYVDPEVMGLKNMIVGANQTGWHILNVNTPRDFTGITADLRCINKGDASPCCGRPVSTERGIEVGQIFKLGTKYSRALNCMYVDEKGHELPVMMGSYGIGISRTMAAVIEQNHDENGIIWPLSIAPFHVVVVPVSLDSVPLQLAEHIYDRFSLDGLEVLLDDRDERAGVKFKDADLAGIPLRITVGRKAGEDIVEFKLRSSSEKIEMNTEEAMEKAVNYIKENML